MAKNTTARMPVADYLKMLKYIIENKKTVYGYGGWGQPATKKNVEWFISYFPQNQSEERKKALRAAGADTFILDCFCGTVKSVIDGFCGDPTKPYGGATYGSPCPDTQTMQQFLADCTGVSTDMSNIHPGEILVYKDYSHCGVYYANGLVIESTYNWSDGLQFTKLDQPERKGKWHYHGFMTKWIDYTEVTPKPSDAKTELQACVKEMQTICNKMNKLINTL